MHALPFASAGIASSAGRDNVTSLHQHVDLPAAAPHWFDFVQSGHFVGSTMRLQIAQVGVAKSVPVLIDFDARMSA